MKKLLYILALVFPILVLGQTTSKNYVKTTAYKKAVLTTDEVTDEDKIEQVTYYDGLGRPIQSNTHRAGGGTIEAPTELTYDWEEGSFATGFFYKLGSELENEIISDITPFGDTDLLWKCGSDVETGPDGGWNTAYFTVDNTKTYRYTTWVKRTGNLTNGRTYHGTRNVNNLDGTSNTNPYFFNGFLPELDTWYLLVGVVHPHDYTEGDTGESGVYDLNGNKVLDGVEFKWDVSTTISRFRNYLFSSTDINTYQYFYKPLLQKLDGSEWSIPEIIVNSSSKDIVTHIEYDDIGRQSKTYLPYAAINGNTLNYRTDAETATIAHYQTNYGADLDASPNPFSEMDYEASPLNRVLQQAAPGKDWSLASAHTVKFDYQTNIEGEVRNYGVEFLTDDTEQPQLIFKGDYLTNELYKTITKDENWTVADGLNRTTEEFKDKLGRVILKRTYALNGIGVAIAHDTQYVYDDFGNLTYVLSPKGSDTVLTMNEYTDFGNIIPVASFVQGKAHSAQTGTAVVSLSGTTLSLNVNLSFGFSKQVKTGAIFLLTQPVPNISFNTGGTFSGYEFKVEDGYLTVFHPDSLYSTSLPTVSSLSGTFEVELPEYEIHPEVIDDLCYQYKYDNRNRLIEKKIPQKGWEYIVYDNLDRPTLTQDQNLKTQNKWLFTKYDAFGRVVYTGLFTYYSERADLQAILNTRTDNDEERITVPVPLSGTQLYYSNGIYPQQPIDLLTINYYDDYAFDTVVPVLTGTIYGESIRTQTKSLATGSKVKVLGTNQWITTITQYDKKSRPIYVASYNEYLNTTDTVKSQYDFIGNVLKTESSHVKDTNPTIVIEDDFTYDHQNRLLTQSQTISGNTEVIVSNEYDDLGQLIKKNVGNDLAMPLQTVDYAYNIRGWLKQINDVENIGNDLFSFKLNYNTVEGGLAPTTDVLYNGNISQTIWKTANDLEKRSYTYTYDGLNRINEAHTRKGATLDTDMMLDLSDVNYDKNGNILNLFRNNLTEAIDDLDYTYNGNQLTKVTDLITTNTEGFKDGFSTTGDDYTYDVNGNMIADQNKDITSIVYNHLNLPTTVIFGSGNTITYNYDATGVKLSKQVNDLGASSLIETKYAGNYIYKDDVLEFFNHPEGYVETTTNPSRPYQYIYQYKDHLGNIRLSYSDDDDDGHVDVLRGSVDIDGDGDYTSELREESNYYPFGLKHKGYNNVITGRDHKYGYNGIELNEDLGYNMMEMDMRQFDPAIARWTVIDPVTHYNLSPYNSFDNNPIYWADPSGADSEHENWVNKVQAQWNAVDNGANFLDVMKGSGSESSKSSKSTENPIYGTDGILRGYTGNTVKGTPIIYDGDFSRDTNPFDILVDGGKFADKYFLDNDFNMGQVYDFMKKMKSSRDGYAIKNIFSKEAVSTIMGLGIIGISQTKLATNASYSFRGITTPKPSLSNTNVVYEGIDASGVVRYVGITQRNAAIRFGEHLNSLGTGKEFLNYRVIQGASGLSRTQAKVWEQTLINRYGLQKNGGQLLNKINSISQKKWSLFGI